MISQAESEYEASVVARFQESPPVDVRALATALGLKVWETDRLPDGVAGKLVHSQQLGGTKPYGIVVRASDPYVRKRFTVAHELAHFLLHRNKLADGGQIVDNDRYRADGISSPEEVEANRTAAEILMPDHLIQRYRVTYAGDAKRLASLFGVSELAMRIRLGY